MKPIDWDKLLQPIAGDRPGGPSLEGDPDFLALEIAATRHPETEIGGLVTPAREPDWAEVRRSAIDLLERSKDLQVAVHLAEALIHNDGLAGFRQGLFGVQALLERHWDGLHPELTADDPDGAASERIMRLKGLGDRARIVSTLRDVPLLASPRHGSFSLRDIQALATANDGANDGANDRDDDDQDIERSAALQDACQSTDTGLLQTAFADARACRDGLHAIVELIDAKSDVPESLGFEAVVETIQEIEGWLEDQLRARGADLLASPDRDMSVEGDACTATSNDEPVALNGVSERPSSPGTIAMISTRSDALKTIDLLCAYFERHEPSSPVPLILRRAKRLVAKDFMTILRDLVPDGLDQMEKMVGECPAGEGAGD